MQLSLQIRLIYRIKTRYCPSSRQIGQYLTRNLFIGVFNTGTNSVTAKLSNYSKLFLSILVLANYPPALIRKEFNVEVERTVRELNGQKCKGWDTARADKKQIFSTRSAGQRITDLESLQQALCKHANIASFKARKQKSLCRVMLCFANSSPFDSPPVARRAVHRFAYPTADVTLITQAASRLAEQLFQQDVRFYKIGVGLIDLVDGQHEQPDLFNLTPNNPKLMNVYDTLNNRFGSDAIFLAAQGITQKWAMRREMLSPQYTTRWKDLPKIKC